jgi:hypothetical protein
MKKKPTSSTDTLVYAIKHVWRGIYRVEWTNGLNYPRTYETLYRKQADKWTSGEANPTGCRSDLLRDAPAQIAAALDQFTLTQST